MKILFLGYSKLFKNKLISTINQIPEITEVHIAKFKDQKWDDEHEKILKTTYLYDDYDTAMKIANVDVAYVSTVNSTHFDLAKQSILNGWHTIVDKPIVIDANELDHLLEYAVQHNVMLSESLVYTYHPMYDKIRQIFADEKDDIVNISVDFSFPPLDKSNFRYNKELGGGAINDLGPYAVSIGRYFFNEVPKEIGFFERERMNDVEISFNILLRYSNNRTVSGHFGFTSAYVNELGVVGNTTVAISDRAFTFNDKSNQIVKVSSERGAYNATLVPADTFLLYFQDVLNAIVEKNYNKFHMQMIMDVNIMDNFRNIKLQRSISL
jgi:dTDP-3,4-didehydro-2,6-dideoxy-alpha-D-glucose 3-reductase